MKKYLVLFALIFIQGCSSGGDSASSSTPTDTSLVYSTFPAAYFDGSYSASYSLTGSYSNGEKVTATVGEQSGSTATFNSNNVKTIDKNIFLKNVSTGAVVNNLGELYYSTDINNLTYEGTFSFLDGVSAFSTSSKVIPLSGTIGDFGNVGTYTRTDGQNFTQSWSIQDGFNGKAKFVMTVVQKDASNVLFATSIESWTISQNGTREAIKVEVTLHQSGNLTLTLSSS